MGKQPKKGAVPILLFSDADAERRSRLLHKQDWRCARCRGVCTGVLVIDGDCVRHDACLDSRPDPAWGEGDSGDAPAGWGVDAVGHDAGAH